MSQGLIPHLGSPRYNAATLAAVNAAARRVEAVAAAPADPFKPLVERTTTDRSHKPTTDGRRFPYLVGRDMATSAAVCMLRYPHPGTPLPDPWTTSLAGTVGPAKLRWRIAGRPP